MRAEQLYKFAVPAKALWLRERRSSTCLAIVCSRLGGKNEREINFA